MDDLTFRKSVLADPKQQSDELQEALNSDKSKQAFHQDVLQLDEMITKAAKVNVPEDLAKQLILRQSLHSHRAQQHRNRWFVGLAASFAFALGIGLNNYWFNPYGSLGDHALAHVYHELPYSHTIDEELSLEKINIKMAKFGGNFSSDIGKIYFANFCDFKGQRSLHMIMEGEEGKVSVFIVPHDESMSFSEEFNDNRFDGKSIRASRANLIVVGEKGEPLNKATRKLNTSIRWQT